MTVVPETDRTPQSAAGDAGVSEGVLRILAGLLPEDAVLTLDADLRGFGLESLAMTRLWFALRKEFGADIPVKWLGSCPTPGELVARVVEERGGAGPATAGAEAAGAAGVTADPGARLEPFALTDLQQAYLVAKDPRLGPDPIGCHLYREFEVADLDPARLAAAWGKVVAHHEMLRVTMTDDGRQVVRDLADRTVVSVHDVVAADFDAHVLAVRERLSHQRFDAAVWPLWAVEVSQAAGRPAAVVHLSLDVLLTDGHGLSVLLDDWWRWYQDPAYSPAPVQLSARDGVMALARSQKTAEYREHLAYWKERLAGLPDGPALVSRAAVGDGRRTALTGEISAEQWRTVCALASDWDTSPTSVVLTLFAEAFAWLRVPRPFSLVLTTNHRVRLPAELDDVVGPFTSSLVLPMPDTLDEPLPDAVRGVHERLWLDLDHAAVSGVAALRALRGSDRTAPQPVLPVVFTSLLGTGRAGVRPGGLADATTYAVSQTTGVALDHQMWEQDGALRVRWDAVPELFPTGALETLFGVFLNSLNDLTRQAPEIRPMNELQQAYCVPRAVSGPAPWDGCQAYHSFPVVDLDLGRLEAAWLRLVAGYEAMRTVVTRDGRLAVAAGAPDRRHIPVVDLAGVADPEAFLADLRHTMAGRAFPLGRGPHSDLLVTRDAAGLATVHLTIDLTVNDGRSIHFLVRELFRLYADPAAEPRAVRPHADFLAAQSAAKSDPGHGARVRHWRERVASLPPGPGLPALDPAGPEPVRRRREGVVAGWRAVREAAEREGVTPDDLLAAALALALADRFPAPFGLTYVRWTDDTAAFRPGEYTALSWVTRDDPGLGLWGQAKAFRRVVADDEAADGVRGLGELRRRVMRERRAEPFDLPVVYTGLFDLTGQALPDGVTLGRWLTCTPDVALDCISIEEGDELRYYWDAVEARFPDGVLDRMWDVYRSLIEGLAAGGVAPEAPSGIAASAAAEVAASAASVAVAPETPASGSELDAALRDRILYDWNATDADFPADEQMHRLFEEQARLRPGSVALRWAQGIMTFGDLNQYANRIAWRLKEAGVGPETGVGVSVPRGPEMIAAVFGVLKAGGFYVPLEPSLPAERAATIIGDAALSLVLMTTERRGWSAPDGVAVIEVDALAGDPAYAGPAGRNPEPAGTVDSTAYVIFTSGSTGKPKGVAVAHRPVLNLLNWCRRTHGFGPDDVGLSVTSLGFDLSVFDIFGLLGCGATLYLANEAEQRDPELLLDILLSEPVTFWNSAPTTLNQLAPLFAARGGDAGADSLRLVYLSGDYTPLTLPDEVRGMFPGARVVSLGGATEATVWSNWFEVRAIDPDWRSIPYGRPIDNARYYILDEQLEPVAPGVEGDLFIGGECLSIGYYRQPELTAERFIQDPFSGRPGGRMYRTGDRASFFDDGVICFLGRADGQVKVHGFRVELGEIEYRLRAHPGVKDVVVLAREDRSGDRRLVAYVVPAGAEPPAVGDLRRHAGAALPEYMVPSVVVFVDTFPATDNGKLDRGALPWPAEPGSRHVLAPGGGSGPGAEADGAGLPPEAAGAGAFAAPVSGRLDEAGVRRLAEEIAEIFAEVLDVPPLGIEVDVWDHGATSFTMIQVSAALKERRGRRVPVSVLLTDPTALGIARAVLEGGDEATESQAAEQPTSQIPADSAATPAADSAATPAAADSPAIPAPARIAAAAADQAPASATAGPLAAAPGPGAATTAPASALDFFSAADRAAFKSARHDLRRPLALEPAIVLDPAPLAPAHLDWRASRRDFTGAPIPFAAFSRFLALLGESELDGRPRRLYPSAGDTYAVQAYLHVRPGAVEGVPEGLYYYHPADHALRLITSRPAIDRSVHFVYNRPVFDRAGFEVYLFGQTDAIEPLYGADTDRFLLLEAGYIGQLLMLSQASAGLGLCPIGTVALDSVRRGFGLNGSHRYLHAFLAGPVDHAPVPADGARPLFVDGPATGAAPAAAREPQPDDLAAPVAVIGAAGRFPGADGLDEYWRNLSQGVSSLAQVPQLRQGQVSRPETAGRAGGYLADIDSFDSLLFHISPQEARTLDPQGRLLLHTVWECLESAGYSAPALRESAGRVGVFLGAMWQDYQHVGADQWRAGETAVVSATASETANRVSHFFGFDGPSIAVDTSCSSSLAALHLAVASLRRGECGAAIVAAANLLSHPYHLDLLDGLGLLASTVPQGAFDATVPGWTPGEGVAAVLLRLKETADTGHDTVLGVIEETRIGHLGGAGRFGAPDAAALRRAVTDVLAAAGHGPAAVDYVECAAAGAALADAAEIEALTGVFADRAIPVPVGTVKPNIGHLEAAAGLSQLLKVLLQFRHRQLAPTLVAADRNPLISWSGAKVRPVDKLTHWTPESGDGSLRALVSAVGATGSYGHVVVRSADPVESADAEDSGEQQIIVLSAETAEQLTAQVRRLREHLTERRRAGAAPGLADVAFTLQTGRADLRHRLAVGCSSMDEALAALAAAEQGVAHPALAELPAIAQSWLAGAAVDWSTLRPAAGAGLVAPRRIPLPTYPFEAATHRLAVTPAATVPSAAATALASPSVTTVTTASRQSPDTGLLLDHLKTVYADLSGIARDRLDETVPLEHYGLTSLLVAQLTERLGRDLGDVPATLFFEHRDLAGVAGALSGRALPVASPSSVEPVPSTPGSDGRMAIIGIAGRYPQAADLSVFWRNLLAGHDAITPLPADRRRPGWPADLMVGGFLDDVDRFDPLFFGITPREAALMDPQERLFLQTAWHTLEDAGYTRAKLRDRHAGRAGVFVGSMYNEYPFFGVAQGARAAAGTWQTSGSAIGGIANRVSYFLDLSGPSMTVDTMCSSSLTALHLAVTSLRRGECEVALVGGVNLSLHPNKFLQLRELTMSSTDHRCRSFGAGGDGFVPGEGVGAVLLKPLAAALADGDRIHAVVLGTAVNHDGKTNGYTVPNPVAQGRLIRRALRDACAPPGRVGCLEAHGTGTSLGDPIEVNGLTRAFGAEVAAGSCAIGSVKSNIGHLEAAAGIAGLTKAVLQLRHGTLVPSLHAEELNPNIDWTAAPFRVQRAVEAWAGERRRAGISAFGAGGANAHAVVESFDGARVPVADAGPQLILLSARTDEQVRALSGAIAAALRDQPGTALADVAYTLRAGREPMRERLAVVVSGVGELAEVLERVAAGDDTRVTRGRAAGSRPVGPAGSDIGLDALARHWVDGGLLDGALPDIGHIVSLPGYPFARMRCWLAEPEPSAEAAPAPAPAIPLLAPEWVPAEAAIPSAGGSGAILCLYRGSEHRLAEDLASAFAPRRVILLNEDAGYPDRLPADVTGWLDLCALTGADGAWEARLRVLQQAMSARPREGFRAVQVTSGLLDLAGARPSLAGARLAGFVRTLGAEFSWAQGTVLDVDRPDAAAIVEAWNAADVQSEIGVRDGVRQHRRLVTLAGSAADGVALNEPTAASIHRLDPDRVYLVTGGTRGLGALAARHLITRGARKVAIVGASPLPSGHEWTRDVPGVQVAVFTGGLEDRSGLIDFLAGVRADLGALAGVLHCAGRSSAGRPSFLHKQPEDVRTVLTPKTDGADLLIDLTRHDRLDFFVLYSSVSAAVPALAAGVSDYSAANAYLDYTAGYQSRTGRPEIRSVQWPVWRETGGGTARPDACSGVGLDSLADAAGLRILDQVLAGAGAPVVLAAPWLPGHGSDPTSLLAVNRADRSRSADAVGGSGGVLPAVAAPTSAAPAVAVPGLAPAVPAPPPAWLVTVFSETLGIPAPDLDPTATFGELGVESVLLTELVTKIESAWGRPLDPAALLDHPTLDRLAACLAAQQPAPIAVAEPTAATPAAAPAAASFPAPPSGRIAVIGMSCRFPGAPDLTSFWRLLRDGTCAITEVPSSRAPVAALYHPAGGAGRTVSKWGGIVEGVQDFDPAFFGMGDAEARNLDPAIRMTLEASATVLRDAGYTDAELRGRDVGVFVGARMSRYRDRIGVESAASGLGGDQNFIAARIAHHFDFRGPNLVVDSACSSALVSVQLACRSLLAGETEVALAGGVEVLLDEEPYLEFTAARALSPRGRCSTFDKDADGFVPGEGCGMLLLKPLEQALRDGDRVHAVIDAVAVGNDGHTMGLTTPNPTAQAQVVRRALALAGIGAADVALVEAHGTATMIGDPIELRALTEVFREQTDQTGFCAVGSVKSNIGHLLSAAGIAGLVKALLAVEHGELPPTLFCDTPNPRFDFAASPFFPNTALRAWPAGLRRVAGVSAFGLGGTNAHAIVSALEPQESAAWPVRRAPLPAPVFQRRRLWWEREAAAGSVATPVAGTAPSAPASDAAAQPQPQPQTAPVSHPVPAPAPPPPAAPRPPHAARPAELVASVLDLTFH